MRLIVRKLCIPMGVVKPVRGTAQTDHNNTAAKLILNAELPSDDLAQTFMMTIVGRDAATKAIILSYILYFTVSRLATTYKVERGSDSILNNDDQDVEPDVIAVGTTNYRINMTDTTGDLGVVDWAFSLQLLESISLA